MLVRVSGLVDGLHLSPIGQAFLAQEFLNLLRLNPAAHAWNPDRMPDHYPSFTGFQVCFHSSFRLLLIVTCQPVWMTKEEGERKAGE